MTKKQKKGIFLVVKLAVAFGLLGWVISMVHWRDYVADKAGKEYTVLEAHPDPANPQWLRVSAGRFGAKEESNHPASDFVAVQRPGTAQAGGGLIRQGLRTTLAKANLLLLAAVLAGYVVSLCIIALRWRLLLRIQNIPIGILEALKLTFLGQFYNTVIPGTVGGDLVKAYYITTHTTHKAGALISIFVDRVLGFAELGLLAGAMLVIALVGGLVPFAQLKTAAYFVVLFLGAIIAALAFLLSPGLRRLFHLQKIYQRLPIAHHIAAAGDAADLYRRRIGSLAYAILITFGAQILWICSIGLLGKALDIPTHFLDYLVFVPLIYMCAAFIPVPGGVGPVEGAFVLFLSTPTCTASEILALALLARLMDIARGLPGLWVVITGPRLPKSTAMEAELAAADAEAEGKSAATPQAENKPS